MMQNPFFPTNFTLPDAAPGLSSEDKVKLLKLNRHFKIVLTLTAVTYAISFILLVSLSGNRHLVLTSATVAPMIFCMAMFLIMAFFAMGGANRIANNLSQCSTTSPQQLSIAFIVLQTLFTAGVFIMLIISPMVYGNGYCYQPYYYDSNGRYTNDYQDPTYLQCLKEIEQAKTNGNVLELFMAVSVGLSLYSIIMCGIMLQYLQKHFGTNNNSSSRPVYVVMQQMPSQGMMMPQQQQVMMMPQPIPQQLNLYPQQPMQYPSGQMMMSAFPNTMNLNLQSMPQQQQQQQQQFMFAAPTQIGQNNNMYYPGVSSLNNNVE